MKKQHYELAKKAARHLRSRFFKHIRADVEGFEPPRPVSDPELGGEFTPAISAGGVRNPIHFVEVALPSMFADDVSAKRWEFFARLAQKRGGHFRVAVPKGGAEEAVRRLGEFDLAIKILEL